MYEKMRLEEINFQREQIKSDEIRRDKDDKRFCIEIVRNLEENLNSDASKLVKEATILYNFIK